MSLPMFMSVKDILRTEIHTPYLLEPVVPMGGIVFMYGKRGIGKTNLALTMAACLSNGGTLFGRYPSQPSTVVYIQADTPYMIQRDRLIKASRSLQLRHVMFHFHKWFNLLKLQPTDEFVERLNQMQAHLIVWDTLRKIHRSSSNDDDVPSLVYGTAQELFPDATHCFIHHDKKTVVDPKFQLDAEEAFRGSGAWLDDADTGLHLTEPSPGKLVLSFAKVRTCEPQDPIGLTLNKNTMLLYTSSSVDQLIKDWTMANPNGTPDDLYYYLLSCFACGQKTAARLAYGG